MSTVDRCSRCQREMQHRGDINYLQWCVVCVREEIERVLNDRCDDWNVEILPVEKDSLHYESELSIDSLSGPNVKWKIRLWMRDCETLVFQTHKDDDCGDELESLFQWLFWNTLQRFQHEREQRCALAQLEKLKSVETKDDTGETCV